MNENGLGPEKLGKTDVATAIGYFDTGCQLGFEASSTQKERLSLLHTAPAGETKQP